MKNEIENLVQIAEKKKSDKDSQSSSLNASNLGGSQTGSKRGGLQQGKGSAARQSKK